MTIDEWRRGIPTCEGPVRPEPLPEKIEPGDVLDDGSVMTNIGHLVASGTSVWMTERKARAAAYYGWRLVCGPAGRDGTTGEIIYPMVR